MTNKDLRSIYDAIYKKGADEHYTKSKYNLRKEIHDAILESTDWNGKSVLDVGCGTGDFAFLLANTGSAAVTGIDYSPEAIREATANHKHPNLRFVEKNLFEMDGMFDVIVSLGTLEHMDDPLEGLRSMKNLLNDNGSIIVTVPNFLNPRGFILLTLLHLFDAKITLADLHHLSPTHFEKWADELDMDLDWKTVNHSWGCTDVAAADLRERLPKVSSSSNLGLTEEGIASLTNWLEQNAAPLYQEPTKTSGALGVFHLCKR